MTQQRLNGWAKVLTGLAISLLAVAVTWGMVQNQLENNSREIERLHQKKLDREVFEMYCTQQREAAEKIDRALERIDSKLDRMLNVP